MVLVLGIDCPFCGKENVAAELFSAQKIGANPLAMKPMEANLEAAGKCCGCGSFVLSYFFALDILCDLRIPHHRKDTGTNHFLQAVHAQERNSFDILKRQLPNLVYHGTLPAKPGPTIPRHLPGNVERALKEAEEARLHELWNAAASHYRKAVDRALNIVLDRSGLGERAKGKMLGPKLGLLEKTTLLPASMLEWIRLVKDDGNFALHDDDRDFESGEEIEPARRFALLLLEYLFTLPKEIELARKAQQTRDS